MWLLRKYCDFFVANHAHLCFAIRTPNYAYVELNTNKHVNNWTLFYY